MSVTFVSILNECIRQSIWPSKLHRGPMPQLVLIFTPPFLSLLLSQALFLWFQHQSPEGAPINICTFSSLLPVPL